MGSANVGAGSRVGIALSGGARQLPPGPTWRRKQTLRTTMLCAPIEVYATCEMRLLDLLAR